MSADGYYLCPKCKVGSEDEESQTFRAYHEFWFEGEIFKVRFEAYCEECGFAWEYHHEEIVKLHGQEEDNYEQGK